MAHVPHVAVFYAEFNLDFILKAMQLWFLSLLHNTHIGFNKKKKCWKVNFASHAALIMFE